MGEGVVFDCRRQNFIKGGRAQVVLAISLLFVSFIGQYSRAAFYYFFELQSQPKVSGHPQKKALPRFPSFNVATMMSTFLSIFFWTCKTTLGRGYGGKGSHCPMLLSEIVWKSYVKYVVSFYVMWISTLLQSHVRAPPVQRWRCTILNKIITAATAVKLHGNRCSLNHVDMNL